MKKILVTGGNGFIGKYVIENLLEKGYQVTSFDRIGTKAWSDDINYYWGDIKDNDAVFDAIYRNDAVINLAGILGTQELFLNPIPSIEVNIIGAMNVFNACRDLKKRCTQIAIGNYWMNNPYSIAKSAAARFALSYNKEFGTEIAIVRGLNAYGPRQKHRPVRKITPNLIIPALLNKPITLYGSGEQKMDMIYVGDLAEILVRATVNDHGVYDKQMEAGTGKSVTINYFTELVIKETGSKSEIIHTAMRPGEEKISVVEGDPKTLLPLGIKKEDLISLEEGIKGTVGWYKEHLDEFSWDE